ncbi:MAG TPA: hypothetical protein VND64_05930 [Pirellulales bacterium]|nr:hypothetical protein [Pirellulales bacterium]
MTSAAVATPPADHNTQLAGQLELTLSISESNVVAYLSGFPSTELREAKAVEALKVGVIAIQSASPTLDTRVVQEKFSEMRGQLGDFVDEFQTAMKDDLKHYFQDKDGQVPRSLDAVFGPEGRLGRTLHDFFGPEAGKVARLLQTQIGPESAFSRALDPKNKDGIIARIEKAVEKLVQNRFDELLGEFSLDDDESALARLQKLFTGALSEIRTAVGVREAEAGHKKQGHVKGMEFEEDLYTPFAELGRQLGDETECVGDIKSASGKKTGDYVATLGETTGAPGLRIVVEAKNKKLKFKDAIDELQEAKQNRQADRGIFVYAKGCEPLEVGDLRMAGEDVFCTVDWDRVQRGEPLTYLDAAYKIARTLAVATVRKDAAGEFDLQLLQEQVDGLVVLTGRIGEIMTKAKTVRSSGEQIEKLADEMRQGMDSRLAAIVAMLRRGPDAD